MKQALVAGVLTLALVVPAAVASGQPAGTGTVLGTVNIPQRVMADGQPLAAGTYQVRLTDSSPKPAVGQSPDSSRYVEFVRNGQVAGREVATVIPAAEIGQVVKGPRPGTNASRVELLKGGDYVRVWLNREGTNYLIHLPPA